jgi:ubiquinone/menaquinone biosynthesis C-methylase UbiE
MESLEKINLLTQKAYNKAAQKYYDLFYNEFEKKGFDKIFIDEYLEYFNPNSLICNVGCGPCGHIENYIFQKGKKVIGIDISDKCIEIANHNHPKIHFEIGDFAKLKYNENHFDGIISYYSIIDTPKIYLHKILKEFNRVLKRNGYLLLAVKEGETEGYEEELLGIKIKIYYSLFTKKEIKTALEKSGFENIRIVKRNPYADEIQINRIFSISKKVT